MNQRMMRKLPLGLPSLEKTLVSAFSLRNLHAFHMIEIELLDKVSDHQTFQILAFAYIYQAIHVIVSYYY
jgi:hypothetical protein